MSQVKKPKASLYKISNPHKDTYRTREDRLLDQEIKQFERKDNGGRKP